MNAFPHIDQTLANNPGVTPEMLKNHPHKKWTVEEFRYLESLESTPKEVAQVNETQDTTFRDYTNYVTSIFRPGDTLCFVGIVHNKDKGREQIENDFVPYERAISREYFQELSESNTRASIYVATSTFPASLVGQRAGRTQENVVEVRAVQADVDANGEATINAIKSSAAVPQPSIVVESSPGKFQGIWLVDGISKADAKPLMQAIAAQFHTDSAVAEVARVMRVPGFVNRKYEAAPIAKTMVQIDSRYHREDFKVLLPQAVLEQRVAPEEYLNAPFIRKGGLYGGIYNHVLKIVGHYVSSIKDGDVMFDIVKGLKERNGCFLSDGITPYEWSEEQVRQQCLKLVNEWKDGGYKLAFNQQPTAPTIAAPASQQQAEEAARPLVVVNGDDFLAEKIPPRKVLVHTISGGEPVIYEQSINQIFAWRGVGKTCLGLGFVRCMATGGYFLNFRSEERVHVLYVEGELPDSQIQERWKSIIGKTDGYAHLATIDKQPGHHYSSLATETGMAKIEKALEDLRAKGIEIKVLMLDNISTLFNVSANEEEVWIGIQAWFTSLRSRGLTIFFFHHAGKQGMSRSHSKSEDMLDVSIKLEAPDEQESGHLHAVMTFDKARAGLSEKPAEIKLHRTHSDNCECLGMVGLFCPGDGSRWEYIPVKSPRAEAEALFAQGRSISEVTQEVGAPEGTVRRWRTEWGRKRPPKPISIEQPKVA